ncbi:MAG: CTB family bacteriocin [Nostoc sp. DedQUE01]|uniref:CTB family bacteriocin n=1 Tax=Nostoc sp. CCY 9925 TaxID=3103865 RepID=UPI002AD78C76|nr:CTB family bacteriocin [Nostoc sp. DedQUE11]MDZ8074148.1 CTB family bacteriocin [Nostoc sp. DedQUE01]MDZ8078633.1 CTB family bacteriocin [Nostoc sp. DcaGUA01]
MSNILFTDLSNEQLEVVAGGVDFQLDATFYTANENVLNGESSSGPHGSTASSNGSSTDITTAGIAFLTLDADEILDISKKYGH